MKLLQALGLDYKILIAQFVNFGILVFVLWKFGYGPMMKFLDERRNKIEKGVEDAKLATEKLIQMEEHEKEVMINAKKEAIAFVEEAKQRGEESRKKIVEKAKEEVGQIINQEKQKIQSDKADALKEIKREIGDLVMSAVSKILEEKLDEKKDKELITKIVSGLNNK